MAVFQASTTAHDPRDRFEYWRHMADKAVVPMEPLPHVSGQATGPCGVTVRRLGDARLATIAAAGHQVRRTQRLVSARDEEVYTLFLPADQGCRVEQRDRRDVLAPGDVMLLDSSDCYDLHFDQKHQVVAVTFPRARLPIDRDEVAKLTATRLTARGGGVGELLSAFLLSLAQQTRASQLSEPVLARLADTLIELTETVALERLGELQGPTDAPSRVLLLAIRRDIETRLGSAHLSPTAIAARHHISVRYLHRLFEAEGVTVSEWIRRRRLERSRRDLLDPALAHMSAAAIGARWGFREPSHFSRLFKTTFGFAPGAFRSQAPG